VVLRALGPGLIAGASDDGSTIVASLAVIGAAVGTTAPGFYDVVVLSLAVVVGVSFAGLSPIGLLVSCSIVW
jgi:hypothetical protein